MLGPGHEFYEVVIGVHARVLAVVSPSGVEGLIAAAQLGQELLLELR
jgi:hypothetical protein